MVEILLETNKLEDVYGFIEDALQEEFLSITELYECSVPELDYWIKSNIIKRLSNIWSSFNSERFSTSGANIILDDYIVWQKKNEDIDDYVYKITYNEKYLELDGYIDISTSIYLEKPFENFKTWAYNYIK